MMLASRVERLHHEDNVALVLEIGEDECLLLR